MKHAGRWRAAVGSTVGALVLLALGTAPGCRPMSESIREPGAGPNGGFEVMRDGLPVNWLVYSPSTVPGARFRISLDREEVREGRQSVRFDVEECTGSGGWRSPGLATEVPVDPGATYAVSFWVRSDGAAYRAKAGGVSAKTGRSELLAASPGGPVPWTRVDGVVGVDAAHPRLRFELNVLSPGTLWIDGVRIEKAVPLPSG